MLLQNCNLQREAALHDRTILYSEWSEQGKKNPSTLSSPSATTADSTSAFSLLSLTQNSTEPLSVTHNSLTCTAEIHLLKFLPLKFFFQSPFHSSFPKLNIY